MMERHRDRDFRHRDRDRDFRDRDRDRDRNSRRPSRFSDGPPPDHRRSPSSFRVPINRSFESPPRQPDRGPFHPPPSDSGGFHPHPSDSGGFHPPPGGPPGGFWPMGGGGEVAGGFGNDFMGPPRPMMPPPPPPQHQQQPLPQPPSLSGNKRGFPFSGRSSSPDHYDGKSFVKLFVGSVPRTVTEEEIRPLFEEQGKVMEVALIKDKRTGQQQGCCFIKYATSKDADRAIQALHNQYTLPGGVAPIQVRYADGERERLGNGAVEYKLFVGSLNKLAPEKEVEEIFAPYGRIEDVYLMRDERKQSRGCGFVKFSNKDSAMAAINALNGIFTMRGCDQPLIVRFADPKRPRAGEPRASPASGGSGFGPSPPPVIRPASGPNIPGPMGNRGPPNAWQPMSPQNRGPSPNAAVHGFGNQFPRRSGDGAISSTLGAQLGPQGSLTDSSIGGTVSANSTSPQNYNRSFPQVPPSGQQISPLQKPLESPQHFPPPLQLHQSPGMYSQAPTSQTSIRPHNSPQFGVQAPYSQPFQPQQPHGSTGQVPPAQFYAQQNATTAAGLQHRPNAASSLTNSQLPSSVSQPPPFQQSPSQITQMLSQQTQTLQASFQSSQLAFSQIQQQVQMMQPSNQIQPPQQNFQASRQQSQWGSAVHTTAGSVPALAPPTDSPSTSSAPVVSAASARLAPVKCNWTEHTSPDGYKYYYNSVTGESRWVKPEELASYEQQQQQHKSAVQHAPNQPSLQAVPNQQVTQSKPPQFQTQFRQTEQLQNPPFSSMYQAPRGMGGFMPQDGAYPQFQAPLNNSVNDVTRFQTGTQASQDWSWKNNSGGT